MEQRPDRFAHFLAGSTPGATPASPPAVGAKNGGASPQSERKAVAQAKSLRRQQVANSVSWPVGSHVFTVGVDVETKHDDLRLTRTQD